MRPASPSSRHEPSHPRQECDAAECPPSADAGAEGPLLPMFTGLRRRFRDLALRLLGDETEADDVLQDAFCRLWPRRAAIRTETDAEALTRTTVKHLCIDTLRRRKDRESLDENLPAPPDEAEELREREARFRAVEAAVDECLTPLQRQVLRMRDYEGRDYADIARSLDMQETAVRMQLSRARKAVRRQWRDYLRE